MKRLLSLLLVLGLLLSLTGCAFFSDPDALFSDTGSIYGNPELTAPSGSDTSTEDSTPKLDPNGTYSSKEDVALYIHLYGRLPGNYITKKDARSLGWKSGSVEAFAPGKCIGGDRFGNYEGLLPKAFGRTYTECDIDTLGAQSRGAKRIVFSNDGLVYYTDDHYESFTLLYGEA